MGQKSRVLLEEAMGMLEAAKCDKRPLEGAWGRGEKGQCRWPAHRLLEWAAKELTLSRGSGAGAGQLGGLAAKGADGEEIGRLAAEAARL